MWGIHSFSSRGVCDNYPFVVSGKDAIPCWSEKLSKRKLSISDRRIPVLIAKSTISHISTFLQLRAAFVRASYSPCLGHLSRRLMPSGIRTLSAGLPGIGTPCSRRAILMQCLFSMRSYCAARTPSFILRSRKCASLAPISFESGIPSTEFLYRRHSRLYSTSRPFFSEVLPWLYRVIKWASNVAFVADNLFHLHRFLPQWLLLKPRHLFLLVKVL